MWFGLPDACLLLVLARGGSGPWGGALRNADCSAAQQSQAGCAQEWASGVGGGQCARAEREGGGTASRPTRRGVPPLNSSHPVVRAKLWIPSSSKKDGWTH